MELICISCWQPFEHDVVPEGEHVTCPHCGFEQPGPDPSELEATLEANTRPTHIEEPPQESTHAGAETAPAVAATADNASAKPANAIAMGADQTSPENPLPIVDAASPESHASPAGDETAEVEKREPEVPEEDHRWRLMTPENLILFFPEHEALQAFLTGDEGQGYAIACGEGPMRPLTGFLGALQLTDDPLAALANVSPLEGQIAEPEPAPRPRQPKRTNTQPKQARTKPTTNPDAGSAKARTSRPPTAEVDVKASKPVRPRSRRRRATATSDFTFRTSQEKPVWPGRILFLLIGLLTGSLGIYYLAWLGLLPGIVY